MLTEHARFWRHQREVEVEEALQKILKACLAADIACGMSINASQMEDRIKEGWRMLNLGGANGGLNASNAAALKVAQKASGKNSQ